MRARSPRRPAQVSRITAITIDAIRQRMSTAIMYFQLVGIGARRGG
jgi:hypothetical protein